MSERKRKPSESMLRALRIVERDPGLPPSDFARRMWDTGHWQVCAIGKTGGAYLDRLWRMGLVLPGGAGLTSAGVATLVRAESERRAEAREVE